jgi:phage tail protein X
MVTASFVDRSGACISFIEICGAVNAWIRSEQQPRRKVRMSDKATNKRLRRRGFSLAAALFLAGMVLPGGAGGAGLPDPSGGMRETTTYRATHGDTLLDVARRFSLGYVEIVAANPGTDPWIPGEGTNVVLPTVHLPPEAAPEGIVINLADMRL